MTFTSFIGNAYYLTATVALHFAETCMFLAALDQQQLQLQRLARLISHQALTAPCFNQEEAHPEGSFVLAGLFALIRRFCEKRDHSGCPWNRFLLPLERLIDGRWFLHWLPIHSDRLLVLSYPSRNLDCSIVVWIFQLLGPSTDWGPDLHPETIECLSAGVLDSFAFTAFGSTCPFGSSWTVGFTYAPFPARGLFEGSLFCRRSPRAENTVGSSLLVSDIFLFDPVQSNLFELARVVCLGPNHFRDLQRFVFGDFLLIDQLPSHRC